jgi:hypothetical protein
MPLENPDFRGTEKDGSKSIEYCSYCYQKGSFINPDMTLEEMKTLVKEQMGKIKMDTGLINMAIGTLPNLKRWASKAVFA